MRASVTTGALVDHVLNRTVAGPPLFRKRADYEAFERIVIEAHQRHSPADFGVVSVAKSRLGWQHTLRREGRPRTVKTTNWLRPRVDSLNESRW